ncbi:hypothetical protein [Mesorhizobium sp. ORS 3428]|uniref:hypothetical protein n=1 Tax=Mesorhizobium sp. ORS 3428 TaxID=540997 RepID=UPI0008D8E825|nr:hypothetical protein [Mesorhizobium sp. ORS 3428]OHV88716.1 hypothetical protein ORS3428_17945 [Mesorhizobium sp. ORS 3428]
MKKTLLSVLGLSVALAFSVPGLGNAAAKMTTAQATTTTTPSTTTPSTTAPAKKKAKACKPTKTHKCPVKHKKRTTKKSSSSSSTAPSTTAPKTSY